MGIGLRLDGGGMNISIAKPIPVVGCGPEDRAVRRAGIVYAAGLVRAPA
jgi:hypothetical protein